MTTTSPDAGSVLKPATLHFTPNFNIVEP